MSLQTPPMIIDMHVHMFNARYVPLKEIFESRGVPRLLAELLTKLALACTDKSPLHMQPDRQGKFAFDKLIHAQAEHGSLKHGSHGDDADLAAYLELLEDIAISQLLLEQSEASHSFELRAALVESDIHKVLLEIDKDFGDEESHRVLDIYNSEGLVNQFELMKSASGSSLKNLFPSIRRMLAKFLRKALAFVEKAGDFLTFVITMMCHERTLLKRIERYYREANCETLLVHYMMDMDYPFKGKSQIPFYDRQLVRMSALEQFSEGALIGFAAFDPTRFLAEGSAGPDKEAIIQHIEIARSFGKLGFKFYPPMGFRPAQNTSSTMEDVVDIFLDYCVEKRIPVFTHCTPEGFEVCPKSGENAHPKYWEAALSKNEDRKKLILCFGHAGGGIMKLSEGTTMGWLSDDNQWQAEGNYAPWVVRLCRQYENVYCEVAYFHEIIGNSENIAAFKIRLINELARGVDANHPYEFWTKIMYGSDWHMPNMVDDLDDYLKTLLGLFSDDPLANHRDDFFYRNALRYLRLDTYLSRALSRAEKQLGLGYAEGLANRLGAA